MDLDLLLLIIYTSVCGGLLGAFTGITPGLHVNTMALMVLLGSSFLLTEVGGMLPFFQVEPSLAPVLIASLLVSAAVSHSFLDFLPSVFFGAPEESECLTMLPGHRLLLAGRGMEAVTIAAEGSLIGAMLSLVICAPLLYIGPAVSLQARLEPYMPGLMLMAIALMLMNERDQGGAEYELVAERIVLGGELPSSPPLPVDGSRDAIRGQVRADGPLVRIIEHGSNSWRLRRHRNIRPGEYLIIGTWRSRRSRWKRLAWALTVFLLSGLVGLAVLDGRSRLAGTFDGMGSSLLLPLLTGLFALPSLMASTRSGDIPAQDISARRGTDIRTSLQGSLAGLFAAWVPGVTATSGTVLAQQLARAEEEDNDDRALRFIAMTASLGTAATVFGVLALSLTGSGGTGVLVAVSDIVPTTVDMPSLSAALLLSVLTASVLGYFLTNACGARLASSLAGRSSGSISRIILAFEVLLCLVLTGLPGIAVMACCTILGMLPPQVGVSRICLTGCLLFPLCLGCFGAESLLLPYLGG